jgi:catechol 2,3-dioxygenase-like lactoylglutathione lyase family enzyme
MQLLDHVSIAVRDLARAKPFYRAVMAALGAPEAYGEPPAIGFGERLCAGGTDDGAPGLRPGHHASYYAAFLCDPEGKRIELPTHCGDG